MNAKGYVAEVRSLEPRLGGGFVVFRRPASWAASRTAKAGRLRCSTSRTQSFAWVAAANAAGLTVPEPRFAEA